MMHLLQLGGGPQKLLVSIYNFIARFQKMADKGHRSKLYTSSLENNKAKSVEFYHIRL